MEDGVKKIVLYMAISADGFIAGPNDEAEWVSKNSWNSYIAFVKSCDVALVGKKTAKLMSENEFLLDTRYYIVTTSETPVNENYSNLAIISKDDLPDVNKVGVIGGGNLNGSLAKIGLFDEIILDIEPLTLGEGIRLFGKYIPKMKLELISSKKLGEGTIQNHYKVIR